MAKVSTLDDLLIHHLRDLYNAENQIVKALPKLIKKASSPDLRKAFETHLEQTRTQVERLEQVFGMLETKVRGKSCAAMEGIIDEGKEWMGEDADDAVMDAGLIACAQKVEHYEIASYGCVCAWAKELGHEEAARVLAATLKEEEETDRLLTRLAEKKVNKSVPTKAEADAGEDEDGPEEHAGSAAEDSASA